MAGKNEIKHRLSLEGDDEVKAKLKAVGEAGKQSLGDIEKKLGEAHGGLGKLGEPLGELKEAFAPFVEGAELGGLGGLFEGGLIARLFGAAGPAAAIAALDGVALHLAKVSEESEKTDKRLKAFGGGSKAFDELEESAKKLGTSPETLQGGFEDFLSARRRQEAEDNEKHGIVNNPYVSDEDRQKAETFRDEHPLPRVFSGSRQTFGPIATNKEFLAAQSTLRLGASAEHADTDVATRAINQFMGELYAKHDVGTDRFTGERKQETGLTGDALRQLSKTLPDVANRVARVVGSTVGQGFTNSEQGAAFLDRRDGRGLTRPLDPGLVLSALGKEQPNAQKDADAARGVTDAFEGLKASAGQLDKAFSDVAGGPLNKFLKDKIDTAAGGISKAAELVEHNKDKIAEGAKRGYEIGSRTGGFFGGVFGGAVGGGVAAEGGIGGDLIKEYGPELKEQIAKQFESGIPEFLKNAVINPGAVGPDETIPTGGASKLTPEALAGTTIPKALSDSASRKALLVGSPLLGAARFLPELFGLTKGEPPQDAPPPQAQQPQPQQPQPQPQPQPQQPAPEPTLDQLLQQRAAAGPAQERGIVAAIASALQGFAEKFTKPESTKLEGMDASAGTGIRGDAGPLDNGEAPQNVAALNGVAGDAAEGLRQVASAAPAAASNLSSGGKDAPTTTVAARDGGMIRHFAEGGPVSGPDTSSVTASAPRLGATSRVAKAVKRMFARGGPVGFASGGTSDDADGEPSDRSPEGYSKNPAKEYKPPRLGPGDHQITFDPMTGGAFVDGILRLPGDPLLDDPIVKQGMAQSKAGMNDKGSKHERYHSPFVGRFGHDDSNGAEDTYVARGGLLAGTHDVRRYDGGGAVRGPGTSTSDDIDAKLSHGEFVVNARDTARSLPFLKSLNQGDSLENAISKMSRGGKIELPGFAEGGSVGQVPGVTSPGLAPSAGDISSSPMEAGHHAIDMRTDFGNYRVLAPEHIARSMSAAARDSANAQTGQLPSWYKGR